MNIFCLPSSDLSQFIDRTRRISTVEVYEDHLEKLLRNILNELHDFLPFNEAYILLDDPVQKRNQADVNSLCVIAGAGKNPKAMLGKSILSNTGVFYEAYHLGKAATYKNDNHPLFLGSKNFSCEYTNMLIMPLKVESSIVGVLALCNKADPLGFTFRDIRLGQIFGGYFSTSLQNAIDAKKSKDLSKLDDLTGLYNDRHFHVSLNYELSKALKNKHDLCLLFLDLDNFKSVNDTHGHLVGSQTLREIGFILQKCIESPEAILSRYGGDEYVIILPNTNLGIAVDIAEQIRKEIHTKFFMIPDGDERKAYVSFKGLISSSIGVASVQDHLGPMDDIKKAKTTLIKLADAAMYKAKDEGKNQVIVANASP